MVHIQKADTPGLSIAGFLLACLAQPDFASVFNESVVRPSEANLVSM